MCGRRRNCSSLSADLTARDEHLRSTPLAWAAKFGQLEMVKLLLRHGAPKPARRPGMGHATGAGNQARARRDRETSLLGTAWLELPALVRVIHALELASASLYGNFVEILSFLRDWLKKTGIRARL